MALKLGCQSGWQLLGKLGAGGEQNRRSQGVVLGLGHQIGGHLIGLGRVVSDHQDLTGACERIDRYPSVDGLFGQGDVEVARTADHIHPGDGFGPVGQGPNRLGATDAVHLFHARQVGGGKHGGIGFTTGPRRGHHDEPGHASHLGWHRIHQHRAGVGGPATRHIQPCPLHRPPAPAEQFAMGSGDGQILGPLVLVKGQDPPVGQL